MRQRQTWILAAALQAYCDSCIVYRRHFVPVAISDVTRELWQFPFLPRTLGPSKPWPNGEKYSKDSFKELSACTKFLTAEVRRIWPSRRCRKRKKRWYSV